MTMCADDDAWFNRELKPCPFCGSVLRNMEGPAELCPKPAPGLEIDERGVLVRKEDKDNAEDNEFNHQGK